MAELSHLFLRLPLWVMVLLLALASAAYRPTAGADLRRFRHLLAIAVVTVYFGSAPVVSNALTLYLEGQYRPVDLDSLGKDADSVVLVLTAGSFRRTRTGYEARIGEDGWERLQAGIRLHEKLGGRLMFSGAPSPDGRSSVARTMAEVARRLGVPADRVLVEERSTNTYENLVFSKSMLKGQYGRVWLVTSALRMPRAMAVASKQELDAMAYPCDFHGHQRSTWWAWVPANHSPLSLEKSLHEIIGMWVYRVRNWA